MKSKDKHVVSHCRRRISHKRNTAMNRKVRLINKRCRVSAILMLNIKLYRGPPRQVEFFE